MQNARTLVTVERERERERESCDLKETAYLACKKEEKSLQAGKPYIIYRTKKVDMKLIHNKTVC